MSRVSLIIPAYNDDAFLRQTLPRFVAAVEAHGDAELLLVDNGSDPGLGLPGDLSGKGQIRVERIPRTTVAAARNAGAARSTGEILVFCDADCLIRPGHLERADRILDSGDIDATGGGVDIREDGNWVERTWCELHRRSGLGSPGSADVPAASFAIIRRAFESVGGFDAALVTGEDAEVCQRLGRRGFTVRASSELRAIHLGEPRTIAGFWKRNVWHGLGMFGTARATWWDKPTLMLALHLVLTILALASALWWTDGRLLIALLLSQLLVPAAAVVYRLASTGGWTARGVVGGVLLYWLYFWARAWALVLIVARRDDVYRSWADHRRSSPDASGLR